MMIDDRGGAEGVTHVGDSKFRVSPPHRRRSDIVVPMGKPYYRIPETVRAWRFRIKDIPNMPKWLVDESQFSDGLLTIATFSGDITMTEGDWATRSNDDIIRAHSDRDFVAYYLPINDQPALTRLKLTGQLILIATMLVTAVASVVSVVNVLTNVKVWTLGVSMLVIFKDSFFFTFAYKYTTNVIHQYTHPNREGIHDHRYMAR
jgi:hypothetical protein